MLLGTASSLHALPRHHARTLVDVRTEIDWRGTYRSEGNAAALRVALEVPWLNPINWWTRTAVATADQGPLSPARP